MSNELEQARQIVARRCAEKPLCSADTAFCSCRNAAREILAINEARVTRAEALQDLAYANGVKFALIAHNGGASDEDIMKRASSRQSEAIKVLKATRAPMCCEEDVEARVKAEREELIAIIDFIRPALPVLHTMCKAASFKLAAAKAAEMIEALNEVK